MLKQIRVIARQYEDQYDLSPLDAHILASFEGGDSIEQISKRLGIPLQDVNSTLQEVKEGRRK
jgi:hypothetical protein